MPEIHRQQRMLVALAVAAGTVDSVAYLRLHVFTANMTGNTVLAGLALGSGSFEHAREPLIALTAFAVGVGAVRFSRTARALLIVEAGALVCFAFALSHPMTALIVGALSMGIQTAATLKKKPGVSTTYMSGTFTRFAATLSGGGDDRFAGFTWTGYLAAAASVAAFLHTFPKLGLAVPMFAAAIVLIVATLTKR